MPKAARQFVVVNVRSRHRPECGHSDDCHYLRCTCPKRLVWSHNGRIHAQAVGSDWHTAEQKAREMEQSFRDAALGVVKPAAFKKVTVEQAVTQFLSTKTQEVGGRHTEKLTQIFKSEFLPWCTAQGLMFIADVRLTDVERWRATWNGASTTNRKKQGRVIGFFDWLLAHDLVQVNPLGFKGARKIAEVRLKREDIKPTLPLTDEQYEQLLAACSKVNGRSTPRDRTRLRGLVQLMRWSGLAIQDALTLERSQLEKQADGWYLLATDRRKTGVEVQVSIAPAIGDELVAIPNDHPDFFFSNGETSEEDVMRLKMPWGHMMNSRLDEAAQLKDAKGNRVNFHSHMLRDTFAVWCFDQDMSTEDVAALLGHKNIQITQQHYSPWVDSRRKRLASRVKDAFKGWSKKAKKATK